MTSSGLKCEFFLFTISGLKVKVGGFGAKSFVSDLMDVID